MNHSKQSNANWLYIPDHPSRISIIGGSISAKINVLLNLIKHQRQNIGKIYKSKNHLNQSINCLLKTHYACFFITILFQSAQD